jgi:excinuclease UvrABC ATPase subunit
MEPQNITVRGAQHHNLKHIDVTIPRYKLVVLTGVSGSGKSSLAFDTIYAEGQRRYVESLSAYARQFLGQMEKPRVDFIGGLSPAIAIEQKTVSKNPRSTVGTVTEVLDYLRVLYARVGTPHCPQCGRTVQAQSAQQIADQLAALPPGTRFQLLAPVVRQRKGTHADVLEQAKRDGFVRARIDGQVLELTSQIKLAKTYKHTIELIVDRLRAPDDPEERASFAARLVDSVETALRTSEGLVGVDLGDGQELLLSEHNACAHCGLSFPELSPQLFSFNAPLGMCPDCHGLGTQMSVDSDLILNDPNLSILDGALRWYGEIRKKKGWHLGQLEGIAAHYGIDLETPWRDLPQSFRDVLFYGSGEEKIKFTYQGESDDGSSWAGESSRVAKGLIHNINRLFHQTKSEQTRRYYASFMSEQPCPTCQGARLRPEARSVTVGNRTITDITSLSIHQALTWVESLVPPAPMCLLSEENTTFGTNGTYNHPTNPTDDRRPATAANGQNGAAHSAFSGSEPAPHNQHPSPSLQPSKPDQGIDGGHPSAVGGRPSAVGGRPSAVGGRPSAVGGPQSEASAPHLTSDQLEIAAQVLKEIRDRLQFMLNVGLHYLTLDRPAGSLSGGEGQRIRLASQIGCGLVGVLYILDEPSIGLHARDNRALLETLLQLRDMGNTVLLVEHDAETMEASDWLIDLGPGAGILGGEVVAAGTPAQVAANPKSLTGRYLSGDLAITAPNNHKRRPPDKGWLTLTGAKLHNLKNVTVRLPLGLMTCITGVSGSGKSSLISETLEPALARALHNAQGQPGPYERLDGLEQLDKVINITQDPIGRTPRSNPATYVGVFDDIREVFAATPEARARGYQANRFSFNVKGGRCEACQGHGQKKIEMHFLADVWVTCKDCHGTRYNRETQAVRYKGKTISDVLAMDVQEALDFFANHPKIARILQTLHDVGLDYVKLGQSATTLSGGEAQRVKLAKELSRVATGRTLYLLDEPTTGLHFADIQRLLDVLHRLVAAGNTVIVIEHNLDVIKTADWLIDLGPEGGHNGGTIIAEGTPETVALIEASHTGRFLRPMLAPTPQTPH